MSNTLDLIHKLIACRSVTPVDNGCQEILINHLQNMDFAIERMRFGKVDNFWARRGSAKPLFVFAGHTDVVPEGPLEDWSSNPYQPEIRDGYIFGRGAADMKGSLAAMITATERFVAENPNHKGSIGFLITSDEEGPAIDGTVKVVDTLETRSEKIDWCLVGEPSCTARLGDTIKNGRRGSLSGKLTITGIQGHVAYPDLAKNPIHLLAPVLTKLCDQRWDSGNDYFPPTTFQISNIESGTGAENVIPGELHLMFNFRYSTETDHEQLQQQVTQIMNQSQLTYSIEWRHSGYPFLTTPGALVNGVNRALERILGSPAKLSTAGGTSDGRFIAPTGAEIVEFGPINATIHKVNECVDVEDLDRLSKCYEGIMQELLT